MKKIIMASLCFVMTCAVSAQVSKELMTDNGKKQITVNTDGSSELTFSVEEFSKISNPVSGRLCIVIASMKKDCRSGIGFRCGIFDCPMNPSPGPQIKQQRSRQQEALVTVSKTNVIVKFIHPVDWDYLANN